MPGHSRSKNGVLPERLLSRASTSLLWACIIEDVGGGDNPRHDAGDTMPAYWVARSKVNDPVEYKKYTDLVPGIIAKYGGKVLARGGRYEIVEGPDKFH